MTVTTIHDSMLHELIAIMREATTAYMSGDHLTYFELFDHGDDFSLMPPYGGPTRHGYAHTPDQIIESGRFFAAGEATLKVEQTYIGGDLAVLVATERQHGQVGGLPDQDWSLRVTLVFRQIGDRWSLLHRHADPLVREIPFRHLAELARGLDA